MISEKFAGLALALGATSYLIANTALTLNMPVDAPAPDLFASDAFLARLSVATVAVFLLLIGAMGIFSRLAAQASFFGIGAFALTFMGCLFLFAHEWGQVFFLHEVAKLSPEGLNALVDSPGLNLYAIEAMVGLGFFITGWTLLAVSMLISRQFNMIGPIILIGGFVAVGVLAANPPDLWGFVIGNSIIAVSWLLIGRDLYRGAPA